MHGWSVRASKAEAKLKMWDELVEALESDISGLWTVTNAIKEVIKQKEWTTEGHGPYSYKEDDKFRAEVLRAFLDIEKLIVDSQQPASKRFNEILAKAKALEVK